MITIDCLVLWASVCSEERNGKIQLVLSRCNEGLTMNMYEAMKLKREIRISCGIDAKMLDFAEVGFVLAVERKALDVGSYKLLADFAAENNLCLQLDAGSFIISKQELPPR
jgi:hypothetical protein